jgi:hypothetical protein
MAWHERDGIASNLYGYAKSQAAFNGEQAAEDIKKAIAADPAQGTSAHAYTAFAMMAAARAWGWGRIALDARKVVEP